MPFLDVTMSKPIFLIKKICQDLSEELQLTRWTEPRTCQNSLETSEIYRPGLELTGFLNRFNPNRVLILGETEYNYLNSLGSDGRTQSLKTIMPDNVPLFVYSKNLRPFEEHIELGNTQNIPIFSSGLSTQILMTNLKHILDVYFAERIKIHGTLVDVYGIGLLLKGDPGVGKSECALDLVERGHRLVTDDVVMIHCDASVLIGEQVEPIGHIMEIRGVGFVDVSQLFGIKATRRRKRIEVVVNFQKPNGMDECNRTGLDKEYTSILDISVPQVSIPVTPGKNMAVICEVIALDNMLKDRGIFVADEFNAKFVDYLANKKSVDDPDFYLGDME